MSDQELSSNQSSASSSDLASLVSAMKSQLDQQQSMQASILQQLSVLQQQSLQGCPSVSAQDSNASQGPSVPIPIASGSLSSAGEFLLSSFFLFYYCNFKYNYYYHYLHYYFLFFIFLFYFFYFSFYFCCCCYHFLGIYSNVTLLFVCGGYACLGLFNFWFGSTCFVCFRWFLFTVIYLLVV